jgi:hypothetical protein
MLNLSTSVLRILLALTLAVGSWQIGGGAAQAGSMGQRFTRSVLVESISNAELTKYAKALIEIEPLRLAALDTIRSKTNGNLPNLMCHQPDSMSSLSSDARKVFVNYCNQAQAIAGKYGLGIKRFNDITSAVLSNPGLQERLQRQVTCIQNGSC